MVSREVLRAWCLTPGLCTTQGLGACHGLVGLEILRFVALTYHWRTGAENCEERRVIFPVLYGLFCLIHEGGIAPCLCASSETSYISGANITKGGRSRERLALFRSVSFLEVSKLTAGGGERRLHRRAGRKGSRAVLVGSCRGLFRFTRGIVCRESLLFLMLAVMFTAFGFTPEQLARYASRFRASDCVVSLESAASARQGIDVCLPLILLYL